MNAHDRENDSAAAPSLSGDTLGIDPQLARKMLDFEKAWLKVARRGRI